MMLKIWKNYYLDASRVCYTLKKAHTKADGGELKEWEQVRAELQRLESEARSLLQSICPADKPLTPALKNDRNNKCA